MYIEGENIEVLKLLQESYLGKIKMIYIDPPYNTGKDFIYKDDFKRSVEEYDEDLNIEDENVNKMFKNKDSNGRFHSDWCSSVYSTLLCARNLLSNEGVVFISLDDNEIHNLRKICDEIFNANNFVGNIIWQTATDNNPRQISTEHKYVMCYTKPFQVSHEC